jgi:glutaredoxin
MGRIESVTYTAVPAGPGQPASMAGRSLRVYALSTCGFCERSMRFLREQDIGYEFIFIDQLDPAVKAELKDELKARYGAATVFPYLVVDGQQAIVGFTEEKWRSGLGL